MTSIWLLRLGILRLELWRRKIVVYEFHIHHLLTFVFAVACFLFSFDCLDCHPNCSVSTDCFLLRTNL